MSSPAPTTVFNASPARSPTAWLPSIASRSPARPSLSGASRNPASAVKAAGTASMSSRTSNMSALPGRREELLMSDTFVENQLYAAPGDDLALANDLETIDRARVFHPSTPLAQFARGEAPSRIVTGGKGIT